LGKKLNTVVVIYHGEEKIACLDADVADQQQGRRKLPKRKRKSK